MATGEIQVTCPETGTFPHPTLGTVTWTNNSRPGWDGWELASVTGPPGASRTVNVAYITCPDLLDENGDPLVLTFWMPTKGACEALDAQEWPKAIQRQNRPGGTWMTSDGKRFVNPARARDWQAQTPTGLG